MKNSSTSCPFCGQNSFITMLNSDDTWPYFVNKYGSKYLSLTYCNNCGSVLTIRDEETGKEENYRFDEDALLKRMDYFKFRRLEEFDDSDVDNIIELADKEMLRFKDDIIYATFLKGEMYIRIKKYEFAIKNFDKTLRLIALLNDFASMDGAYMDNSLDDFRGPWDGCMNLKKIFENLKVCYKQIGNLEKSDFYANKEKYFNKENHHDSYEEKRARDAWQYPDVSPEEIGLVWDSENGRWGRDDD
jgi:tetratricopeptide (TPR) repeat protein